MNTTLLTRVLSHLLVGALTAPFPYGLGRAPLPQTPSPPPYLQRGDSVDKRYRAHTERLASWHQALRDRLVREAPDLAKKLKTEPPKPLAHGYQILPTIVPRKGRPKKSSEPTFTTYSWPRTERILDRETTKLSAFEERLQKLLPRPVAEARSLYERAVTDYQELEKDQKARGTTRSTQSLLAKRDRRGQEAI